jgi:tripartite-type tricarboxylate transporter receptor subunit TctC
MIGAKGTALLLMLALALTAQGVTAQSYPSKPVRIILSSPGGGTDIVARLAADNMSRSLGAPFVVESRQPNVAAAEKRSSELPQVPTTREAGFSGLTANIWYGLLAPAGMPPALLERLNKAASAAMNSPQVAERLRSSGVEPVGNTPEQFAAFAVSELAKWKRVVETAKIEVWQ